MSFWNKFCGFAVIFFLFAVISGAQNIKYQPHPVSKSILFAGKVFFPVYETHVTPASSIKIIPSNYYSQHLGIICKKEIALEKITKVPLRIRLGSLQQCNYLERISGK